MASELDQYNAQVARDIAHHERRIAWLTSGAPKWVDGTPVTRNEATEMLRVSRAGHASPHLIYNSAPTGDAPMRSQQPATLWIPPCGLI